MAFPENRWSKCHKTPLWGFPAPSQWNGESSTHARMEGGWRGSFFRTQGCILESAWREFSTNKYVVLERPMFSDDAQPTARARMALAAGAFGIDPRPVGLNRFANL